MRYDDNHGSLLGLIFVILLTVGIIGGIAWWLMGRFILPWASAYMPYSLAVIPVIVLFIALYYF